MNERIVSRRVNFSMISNTAITDETLSPRALGLYVKMFYYGSIPEFKLYKSKMRELVHLGRDAFQKDWNELVNKGYLKVREIRQGGRFFYEYEVLDIPEVEDLPEEKSPCTENPYTVPCTEKPCTVNHTPNNTINNNITERFIESPEEHQIDYAEDMDGVSFSTEVRPIEELDEMIRFMADNKIDLSDAVTVDSAPIPAEVRADKKYNPVKVARASKDKNGKQYRGDQLTAVITEASRRFTKQAESDAIGNPWKYYLIVVKSVASQWESIKRNQRKQKRPGTPKPNSFHNFHQRDYDYDQLEKDLLKNQW